MEANPKPLNQARLSMAPVLFLLATHVISVLTLNSNRYGTGNDISQKEINSIAPLVSNKNSTEKLNYSGVAEHASSAGEVGGINVTSARLNNSTSLTSYQTHLGRNFNSNNSVLYSNPITYNKTDYKEGTKAIMEFGNTNTFSTKAGIFALHNYFSNNGKISTHLNKYEDTSYRKEESPLVKPNILVSNVEITGITEFKAPVVKRVDSQIYNPKDAIANGFIAAEVSTNGSLLLAPMKPTGIQIRSLQILNNFTGENTTSHQSESVIQANSDIAQKVDFEENTFRMLSETYVNRSTKFPAENNKTLVLSSPEKYHKILKTENTTESVLQVLGESAISTSDTLHITTQLNIQLNSTNSNLSRVDSHLNVSQNVGMISSSHDKGKTSMMDDTSGSTGNTIEEVTEISLFDGILTTPSGVSVSIKNLLNTTLKFGGSFADSSVKVIADFPWPVKKEAVVEGDLVLGGLMMVHEREDTITCGPIMPQGGIQAVEAMLYTLERLNEVPSSLLPNITLGVHILDDCDKDTYGLEMAVDFIKGLLPITLYKFTDLQCLMKFCLNPTARKYFSTLPHTKNVKDKATFPKPQRTRGPKKKVSEHILYIQ